MFVYLRFVQFQFLILLFVSLTFGDKNTFLKVVTTGKLNFTDYISHENSSYFHLTKEGTQSDFVCGETFKMFPISLKYFAFPFRAKFCDS